ncbi:hypothetical protein N9A63_03720 [Akkermansiaceae bacterium]|nr:hypothetical protein [Akkermansiaceae bacterium]
MKSERLGRPIDFAHHCDDLERAASCLATAIKFFSYTAGVGLLLVLDEKDFVNDWDGELERELL